MTYKEREEYYKKIGKSITEIFKKKYPNICKVSIFETERYLNSDEYLGDIHLRVYSLREGDDVRDWTEYTVLSEINKFIKNFFNVTPNTTFNVNLDNCLEDEE